LDERSEIDLLEHFGDPECTVVLPVNPADQSASLPSYLVTAISMADYMVKSRPPLASAEFLPSLKILDFGNGTPLLVIFSGGFNIGPIAAYLKNEPRPKMQCAVGVRPPEVVFPAVALGDEDPDWDMRSDIWSLGCTVGFRNSLCRNV
jgi:serine/threonine-protein kinase SRPK3